MNYFKLVDKQLYLITWKLPFNKMTIKVVNPTMQIASKFVKVPQEVKASKFIISGYNGLNLSLDIYEPANASGDLPCLIYCHGGGFCYKALTYHKKWAMAYAIGANCKVVFPDYHVAPKYQYPACFEDCFLSYKWVLENHELLGIDCNKIGVGGDSAGGALCALVANACEERKIKQPCLQMLLYPVADITMSTPSMKLHVNAPMWDAQGSQKMWKYFVPKDVEYSKVSLMHTNTNKVIPKTYIELAQYDCLHDEGLLYAQKLKKAGANVILNDTKLTFHAFDALFNTDIAIATRQTRVEFLKEGFENLTTANAAV